MVKQSKKRFPVIYFILYTSFPYSTLLYSALLYSTLLYSTLLYSMIDLPTLTRIDTATRARQNSLGCI